MTMVCMHVRMYVCMYVICMYACMYVWMHLCMDACMYADMCDIMDTSSHCLICNDHDVTERSGYYAGHTSEANHSVTSFAHAFGVQLVVGAHSDLPIIPQIDQQRECEKSSHPQRVVHIRQRADRDQPDHECWPPNCPSTNPTTAQARDHHARKSESVVAQARNHHARSS